MILSNDIIKVMKEEGTRIIPNPQVNNIDLYSRWLSYEPSFEVKKIVEQKKMSILFKKYGTKEITLKEYLKVYNYMKNNSLIELMKSKLSKEELKYADEQIEYYKNVSKEELNNKVNLENNNLSMVDSYILYELSKISYKRNIDDLENIIESSRKDNIEMAHKSLVYASKPNKNRF